MKRLSIPVILTVILSFPAVWLMREIEWLAPAAGVEAEVTDQVIQVVFDIAAVIFVLCMVFFVYSLIAFRRDPDDMSDGEHFHGHTMLEIAWTVVPLAIVLGLWWWGIAKAEEIDFDAGLRGDAPEGALNVKVTAQQWAWTFEYPGQLDFDSEFGEVKSDRLVLPVDRPVRFELNSADVIHSFWIPELRFKMDTIPGRTNHLVLTPNVIGEYAVRCAELCGTDHAVMIADAEVISQEDFQAYMVEQSAQLREYANMQPAERGEVWYTQYGCFACHSVEDPEGENKVGPSWVGLYGAERQMADGSTEIADDDYLSSSILDPASQIVEGYDNAMPQNFHERFVEDFGNSERPVEDIAAYIQSLGSGQ